MRHGEGTHNVAAEKIGYKAYSDERYFDAPLTRKGQTQAERVPTMLKSKDYLFSDVELILSSPLTRAIETSLPTHDAYFGSCIEIHEALREAMVVGCHPHSCNRRRKVSEILARYKGKIKNYHHHGGGHKSDDDPHWVLESDDHIAQRARAVASFLTERKEKHIAVFSHCVFLNVLFRELDLNHHYDNEWFENGEVRTLIVLEKQQDGE